MVMYETPEVMSSEFHMITYKENTEYRIELKVGLKTIHEETFDNRQKFYRRVKKLKDILFAGR